MIAGMRKLQETVEEVFVEGGRAVTPPTRMAAVAAVVENPLAGRWEDDLSELVERYADSLGALIGPRCAALLGTAVEAFGKAALIGLEGEIEHGSAVIHTLRFGDPVRVAAGDATALLPAAEKRGAAGSPIDVPLKHIHDQTKRSHHQTLEIRIPDAPRAGEMVIAVAMSSGGRPHARLAPFGRDFEPAPQ